MGIIGKRATQRAFRPLKERFANDSEGRPGASERDFGVCLTLQRFLKAAALRQSGWYHGVLSSSLLSFLFNGRDGGFFYFLRNSSR